MLNNIGMEKYYITYFINRFQSFAINLHNDINLFTSFHACLDEEQTTVHLPKLIEPPGVLALLESRPG